MIVLYLVNWLVVPITQIRAGLTVLDIMFKYCIIFTIRLQISHPEFSTI